MSRKTELPEAHWKNYIKPLLVAHGEAPAIVEKVGFHYVSSGEHFYGHGWEDAVKFMIQTLEETTSEE